MKSFISALVLSFSLVALFTAGIALAAASDGNGPWADEVTSSAQGLLKNGEPVPAIRSNPASALGVAENDTVDGSFFSLGFGGQITLRFDNGVRDGVIVVESTNPNYPSESARVEVSADNTSWTSAGNVTQDGQVSMPENLTCVNYVRITDTSDAAIFPDDIADGFDVDGVQAVNGEPCTTPSPTPTPTPGNSNDNPGGGNPGAPICTDAKPPTPTLLSVNRNSASTAVLTWTLVTPATDYAISYGTTPGSHVYGVPSTGNTNTFTVGGLAANTNYYFVVRAINGCTPGDPSVEKATGGQVLGSSVGGQVLGASTDVLAATGSFASMWTYVVASLSALAVFSLGYVLLNHGKSK